MRKRKKKGFNQIAENSEKEKSLTMVSGDSKLLSRVLGAAAARVKQIHNNSVVQSLLYAKF